MLTFGELANRLHKMWMNLLPRRCRVHNFMLTWCAWTRQRHVICQAYEQASQHIDDTSGHSQNTNFQITSDILLRAFFMCVFIRSMRSSYYYSDFPTQHAVASFSIDFCFAVVDVDVVMHLFALSFHRVSMICAVHIDIEICSTFISLRCANCNKYQVFRWDTYTRRSKNRKGK